MDRNLRPPKWENRGVELGDGVFVLVDGTMSKAGEHSDSCSACEDLEEKDGSFRQAVPLKALRDQTGNKIRVHKNGRVHDPDAENLVEKSWSHKSPDFFGVEEHLFGNCGANSGQITVDRMRIVEVTRSQKFDRYGFYERRRIRDEKTLREIENLEVESESGSDSDSSQGLGDMYEIYD